MGERNDGSVAAGSANIFLILQREKMGGECPGGPGPRKGNSAACTRKSFICLTRGNLYGNGEKRIGINQK